MLKPDESVTVQYDGEAYTASMTKNGEIELTAAESGTELHDSDITAIYANKFNVFADEEKQEEQQRQIEKLQQECEKKDNELRQTNDELKQAEDKLQQIENELQLSDKKRREIFEEQRIVIIGASSGELQWEKDDGDFITEEELVASNTSKSWREYADGSGILVHTAESGTAMNNNVIGAIICKSDSVEEAREWVKQYAQKDISELKPELLKRYKENRRIVYSTIDGPITWKVGNMDCVTKGQVIALGRQSDSAVIMPRSESKIIAPISGCFIKTLPKNKDKAFVGECLGVIVNKNELIDDLREDLDLWIENLKSAPKRLQPVYCESYSTITFKAKLSEKIMKDNAIVKLEGFFREEIIAANFDGILYEIKKLETETDFCKTFRRTFRHIETYRTENFEVNTNGEKKWTNPFNTNILMAVLAPEEIHMDELIAFKKGYTDQWTY